MGIRKLAWSMISLIHKLVTPYLDQWSVNQRPKLPCLRLIFLFLVDMMKTGIELYKINPIHGCGKKIQSNPWIWKKKVHKL